MKRLFSNPLWLIAVLLLALFLVACERPLQEEESGATPTSELTQPTMVPGGSGTPAAVPTTGTGYPGPGEESGYPAPGEGEETEGGELPGEPAATASPEATQPQEDVVHTVVAGDTLGKIADQYGVSVEAIAAANDLTNIHTLDVGQQLLIPLSGDDSAAETPSETETAEPGTGEQIHVVQAGDNLYRIGLQYGFTIEELAAYNNLANPNSLEIGQEIKIPPEGYTAP